MNARHQQFINEYIKLKCSNKTEAYCRVYPKSSREAASVSAHELLRNPKIIEEIQQRIDEETMSANEVLMRIAEHGRGDIGEFINLGPEEIKQSGKSHLIKKFTRTITTTAKKDFESTTESFTVEMYDALAAKALIGKHHKLFADKLDVSLNVPDITADERAQADKELAEWQSNRKKFAGTLNGENVQTVSNTG